VNVLLQCCLPLYVRHTTKAVYLLALAYQVTSAVWRLAGRLPSDYYKYYRRCKEKVKVQMYRAGVKAGVLLFMCICNYGSVDSARA
jgi:hypothetical protein